MKESKNNLKEKISESKIVKKIKNIKHIEYIVVGIMLIVVGIIFFSTFVGKSTNKKPISGIDYAIELETKLSNVLSKMANVGKVEVMVTLESGPEIKIAYTTEEKGKGDSSIISSTPIFINKNGENVPIILLEYKPKIRGVIVVASGASDMKIRMELLKATQAALKIELSCIEIFAGK